MDQILADAKSLAQRLQYHDSAADSLISDAANLQTKLHGMKEFREEVAKLNEVAKHRPRSTLILGSQLENQRIRDLENENRELHLALADHQSTLELIMNKYREQVLNLLTSKRLDTAAVEHVNKSSGDLSVLREKVTEMATVMHHAVEVDEKIEQIDFETIAKLKYENRTLRELLNISGHPKKEIEKLKEKERLQEEHVLMNGYAASPEERSFDSSADEMDDQMGTVKRKGKNGGVNLLKNVSNEGSDGCRYFESTHNRSSVIEVDLLKSDQEAIEKDESLEKKFGEVINGQNRKAKTDERDCVSKLKHQGEIVKGKTVVSDTADDSVLCRAEFGKPDHHNVSSELTNEIKLDYVATVDCGNSFRNSNRGEHGDESVIVKTNNSERNKEELITEEEKESDSDSDGKQTQEELLDLYNSEGILVEENEDSTSKRKSLGHDSKLSGIKFRRSTKQKKVIQADLKSYFQGKDDDQNVEEEGGGNVDKGNVNSKIDSSLIDCENERALDSVDVEHSEYLEDDDFQQKIINGSAQNQNLYDSRMIKELSDVANMDMLRLNTTGNRIVNIDYNFSPPESPIDSPDFSKKEQTIHRTVQLDYSDSDSDDPEMMVEDQFDDSLDGVDSSSDDSDHDAAGDDDLDMTEEELIGTLDEGGEFVISTWSRLPKDYAHLEDGGDIPLSEEAPANDVSVESDRHFQVATSSNEADEFAFTQAFLQSDQFTGGSIEAKFARRKRYENASIASAVTLSSGSDSTGSSRGSIRSDSDLNLEIESQHSESEQKFESKIEEYECEKKNCKNEVKDFETDDSKPPPDLESELVSPGGSGSSLPASDSSSSGEIDPTIFMNKLSGNDKPGSKVATDLSDILSDLDAELELEDSD